MSILDNFLNIIENKIFGKDVFHRNKCRKEGRCKICGRYICTGCNVQINNRYGYCLDCRALFKKYKNTVALPFRPLIKPSKIKRFEKSRNDD